MNRRTFVAGLFVAPAIIRADALMPVSARHFNAALVSTERPLQSVLFWYPEPRMFSPRRWIQIDVRYADDPGRLLSFNASLANQERIVRLMYNGWRVADIDMRTVESPAGIRAAVELQLDAA